MGDGGMTAISRVSPHALYEVKKFMTSEEKKLIRSLGFGPILEMGFYKIPTRLGWYVVNQFDHTDSSIHLSTGNIKITRESIHDMLGVPIGGKYIGSLKGPKKSDPTTQFWRKQFRETVIRPSSVLEKIKEKKDIEKEETKRLFVLNFLVLFTTCMVEGNQLGSCNTRFLSYITSIDEVSNIDWCGYILRRLLEARRVWSADGKATYFCGSLSTLVLHYLDSTKCASVCVPRKRPTIREWKTSLIKEREEAELETGFGQGEILEEYNAEENNDEEEGHYMDTETETAAPERIRNRPLYHQYEGVGPSAISVVEDAQVNDRPLLGLIEGVNSPKSPETLGTAKRKKRTISVNAESSAQGLLEASKEKRDGITEPLEDYAGKLVDTTLDDQSFAGWIEEVQSPTYSVNSPVEAFTANDMDHENLTFVKTTPLWHTIESMEAFMKLPQKPHFRPLLEGVRESAREGLAIGTMVTFSNVVEKTCCLRFDSPKTAIENCLETLVELESNGFDVELIRVRLTCLLSFKDKQETLEVQSKGVVEKLEEHTLQEKSINEEVDEIDRQIRQLEENRNQVMLKKEKWTSEIDAMKAAEEAVEKEIREVAAKFDGLAAARF